MKSKKRLPAYGTGALAIFTSFGWQAYAETAATSDTDLSEIVVTGVREAMKDSIGVKKNSDLIGDNISTAEIGQLPDVTIAEELNRLPGVNTTRDRGNASQASVRGLGPRLVLGLVNGREVASSEPSQDLRWEIYPSEVLSGAQVYKSQDASLVPGGIAATVDIRTISPLDYKGKEFTVWAGPTYNDEGKNLPGYNPLGYRGSFGYVKHVNDDFAVSVAASAQREKNGFPDFRTFGWNTPANSGATPANPAGNTGDLNGDGVPDNTTWGLNTEIKEVTQDRYAFAGGAGWRANDNLTIKADGLWSEYEIKENQFQTWYGNNITGNWANGNSALYNAPGNSYQIVNGSVVAANLNGGYPNYESEIARYDEKHTLAVAGLNAEWKSAEWDNQADLSFSDAWRRNQWQAIYLSDLYPQNLAFNVTNGQVPYGAFPNSIDPANPALQSAGGFRSNNGSNVNGTGQSSGPEETKDHLAAFALNLSRALDNSFLSAVKFGGRASDRVKTHHENQWGLCAGTGSTTFTIPGDQNSQVCPAGTAGQNGVPPLSLANAGLSQFTAPSFTAPPLVYGNWDSLFPKVYPNSAAPAGSDLPLVRTEVTEKSYEGYVRLDYKSSLGNMPLTGDVGVRVVHTTTTSSGYQSPDGGATFAPVSISNDYTDALPSLNATLHLTDDQLLRFGAAIAISRPPLDALVTGYSLNPTGNPPTGGGGNPKLDPFKADQVDFSYEWYFHPESMLAIAPYYKDVKTYIGAGQSPETIAGTTYIITSENNTKGGEIAGVEVTLQTRFYFLPGFLQDFGVYANHAQVESNIHEAAPVGNPYPMVGFARGTSEFDLFYNKAGFESRVAVKNHTPFTVAPTWVGTTLKMLQSETTLDASVSYTFPKLWSVRLQGRNLTNERARFSTDNNPQNLANDGGYQVYGRSYLLEFGLTF
ncbi:MAG TPA: TonB-dependent receptor [Steroidobacteraceae bacterium]|nr:TonB-dependent receptor [Steroidobacteraceae bacterium]